MFKIILLVAAAAALGDGADTDWSLFPYSTSGTFDHVSIGTRMQPSVSPMTIQPSVSPMTIQPSVSPMTIQPSISPMTIQPSISSLTIQPNVSPMTIQPSMSTMTIQPSRSSSMSMPMMGSTAVSMAAPIPTTISIVPLTTRSRPTMKCICTPVSSCCEHATTGMFMGNPCSSSSSSMNWMM